MDDASEQSQHFVAEEHAHLPGDLQSHQAGFGSAADQQAQIVPPDQQQELCGLQQQPPSQFVPHFNPVQAYFEPMQQQQPGYLAPGRFQQYYPSWPQQPQTFVNQQHLPEASNKVFDGEPVDLAKHPSGIVPTLQNIVATVNMDCKLELKSIALHARNAEYNPKRFAAVIMRIREPKTTALIFASGKMVCTGAKSEHNCKLAARKYARIIQKLGFPSRFKDFKIQNIVGSCDVRFPIRLEGLAFSHGHFSTYEPEIFPGLIYRMKQPKIVLLIFVSGKIVLTGAKVREEIYEAFENIYPVLAEFRKIPQ